MFDLSQYETVDQRLEKFWAKYPDGAIITELVAHKDDRFIFKASVYKTFADSVPFATGFAEEIVTGRASILLLHLRIRRVQQLGAHFTRVVFLSTLKESRDLVLKKCLRLTEPPKSRPISNR